MLRQRRTFLSMPVFESTFDERLIGLALAIGIGFLVGFEREWAEDKPVGLRSFALIGGLGGISAMLSADGSAWPVAGGILGLGLVLAAYTVRGSVKGLTTIIASLVVFAVGAAAVFGYWLHAIVVGGATTLLLHWKAPMHGLVDRIGRDDFEIIARFVLLALVILPVMPDRTFGSYDVFNPFEAWMLVVLIVGINVAGYVAFRVAGTGGGAWMAGILGGMISSTATTIGYANLSKQTPRFGAAAALIILVASAIVYPRVVIELSVVAPSLVPKILGPSIAFGVVLILLGVVLQLMQSGRTSRKIDLAEQDNPARIRVALTFAALYVLILFAVAFARDHIGNEAIYAIAFLSGLTDVDALTLTVGQSFGRGDIEATDAWRAIFLASLANLTFKVGAACALGSQDLRRVILPSGAAAIVLGAAILFFWP